MWICKNLSLHRRGHIPLPHPPPAVRCTGGGASHRLIGYSQLRGLKPPLYTCNTSIGYNEVYNEVVCILIHII